MKVENIKHYFIFLTTVEKKYFLLFSFNFLINKGIQQQNIPFSSSFFKW
jgi:hypothetical protein